MVFNLSFFDCHCLLTVIVPFIGSGPVAIQGDDIVKSMYRLLDGQPFVQWKDSIREVMKRNETP